VGTSRRRQFPTLVGVAVTGVVVAAVLGGLTNAVNGWVCPVFFLNVWQANWPYEWSLWRAAVAQGVLEGLLYGVGFALIYTTGVAVLSRGTCRYRPAVRPMKWIALGAVAGWVLGGFAGLQLAALRPDVYRSITPTETGVLRDIFADAWVFGSIWGIELGGLASVIVSLVLFTRQARIRSPFTA